MGSDRGGHVCGEFWKLNRQHLGCTGCRERGERQTQVGHLNDRWCCFMAGKAQGRATGLDGKEEQQVAHLDGCGFPNENIGTTVWI